MIPRALWIGALAGFIVGAADALVSWRLLGQFASGALGRLACALYSGALAAFALSLLAAALAALLQLLIRHTAFGDLSFHSGERGPSLRRTTLAIAAVPCAAAALAIAMRIGLLTLKIRHHQGLIIAVTVVATAALLAAAVPATFLLARLLELLLRPVAPRLLATRWAPAIAAAILILGGLAVLAYLNRSLVAQLALRPYVVLLGFALTTIPITPLARRLLSRVPDSRRPLLHPVVVVAPLLLALMLGSRDSTRKGAAAHTGLTAPVTALVQRLFDLDRDGYSSVLGGGDCNDLDRTVHPGALDAPGDGIDQNCLGGDVGGAAAARDPQFAPVPASVPSDTNVLLITIDTLRADHLGAYGYPRPTSPAVDAIGARGSVFENGWAHAPSTRYSVPAIITGRHPSEVTWDMRVWWPAVDPANDTIAETLKSRGFFTGAILNYEYFDRVRRMDQGFDVYDNRNARLHSGTDRAVTRGSSSREQADAAIRFLDQHGSKRFFLWVHFYDPHYEYERHPDSPSSAPSFGDDKIALYDGEIRFTDDHIARVLAKVEALGVTGKTIVVITGDHGEGFGEHGVNFHGYDLYAAQTKVPIIIHVPGIAPRRVTTAVGHVDLLPTLANLVGAPPTAQMSGRSLLPFMLGAAAEDPERAVFQDLSWENNHERRGLVTQRWHLIYNMSPWRTFELYDVAADPAETRDLWGQAPEGQALAERLAAMIDATQAAARSDASAILTSPPRPRAAVRADLGDAIRLLGVDLPSEARAGSTIDVTWYWESRNKLAGGWRPFVHFEGPGRFLGDHEPPVPVARWKPGQLIRDRHQVQVSGTPGEYTVYVGWWQGQERLPVSATASVDGGEHRIKAGTLRVLP